MAFQSLPNTRTFKAISKSFLGKGYVSNAIAITRGVATTNCKYMKYKHLRPLVMSQMRSP
ncbi:hypothetical protein [Okeania hirsuta]|uniref:hypothetical protein n=1 Tax=Okeania hirsuta TaxID=1458930 RepID=UPI000F5358A0|nr:hypothetical protein [Okeania hirsuta]